MSLLITVSIYLTLTLSSTHRLLGKESDSLQKIEGFWEGGREKKCHQSERMEYTQYKAIVKIGNEYTVYWWPKAKEGGKCVGKGSLHKKGEKLFLDWKKSDGQPKTWICSGNAFEQLSGHLELEWKWEDKKTADVWVSCKDKIPEFPHHFKPYLNGQANILDAEILKHNEMVQKRQYQAKTVSKNENPFGREKSEEMIIQTNNRKFRPPVPKVTPEEAECPIASRKIPPPPSYPPPRNPDLIQSEAMKQVAAPWTVGRPDAKQWEAFVAADGRIFYYNQCENTWFWELRKLENVPCDRKGYTSYRYQGPDDSGAEQYLWHDAMEAKWFLASCQTGNIA